MNQIEVQIMGQSYLLGCPEGGEARLRQAVERVDAAMCRIRDAGKVKARDRIAVLAALNLAFVLGERAQASASASASEATAGSDAGAATNDPNGLHSANDDARLGQLITRLDQVLADDGRLL
jgi:cell division protein ZapA